MHTMVILVVLAMTLWSTNAAKINIAVWFPEDQLDMNFVNNQYYRPGYVFGFSVVTCQSKQGYNLNPHNGDPNAGPVYAPLACPGGEYSFDAINYGVNATDKDPVVANKWTKTIDLGDQYIGPVYIKVISGQQPLPSATPGQAYCGAAVAGCLGQGNYEITCELCEMRGSPYIVNVANAATGVYDLPMYPQFGETTGAMWSGKPVDPTIDNIQVPELVKVPAPQFDGTPGAGLGWRNISVYIPPSILQNYIPRKINILLAMDGELGVVHALRGPGGFENAVINNIAPESILIGVPSMSDLLQFPDANYNSGDQRSYSLIPFPCNPAIFPCSVVGFDPVNSGGADQMLDFCQENVIPLVLELLRTKLQSDNSNTNIPNTDVFTKGEVSITGGSLGGLIAIYAAGTRPDEFARAWSLDGDVPINDGELGRSIKTSYAASGKVPKYITNQGGTSSFSTFKNPTTGAVKSELDYAMELSYALNDIGMVATSETYSQQCMKGFVGNTEQTKYGYVQKCTSPPSTYNMFLDINGQHSIQTWTTVFGSGLAGMYAPSWPDPYKLQYGTYQQYLSPGANTNYPYYTFPAPACPVTETTVPETDKNGNAKGGKSADPVPAVLGALVGVLFLMCGFLWYKWNAAASELKTVEVKATANNPNPMHSGL